MSSIKPISLNIADEQFEYLKFEKDWGLLAKRAFQSGPVRAALDAKTCIKVAGEGKNNFAWFDRSLLALKGKNLGFPQFVRQGSEALLLLGNRKMRARLVPGYAVIHPDLPKDENGMQTLYIDPDIPWWREGESQTPAEELTNFIKSVLEQAKGVAEEEGEGWTPVLAPLRVVVDLTGPALSVEAWMYYGAIELTEGDLK